MIIQILQRNFYEKNDFIYGAIDLIYCCTVSTNG